MYRWRAFESVRSKLLKKDQSSHPNLWKAPNYDVQQIWLSWNILKYLEISWNLSGLKLHTKKQWSRLSLRTIAYATNTNKKYFYTFRISQITFTHALMFESAVILLQGTRFFSLLRVKGWENLDMGYLVAKLGCHNLHMTQATMNHISH